MENAEIKGALGVGRWVCRFASGAGRLAAFGRGRGLLRPLGHPAVSRILRPSADGCLGHCRRAGHIGAGRAWCAVDVRAGGRFGDASDMADCVALFGGSENRVSGCSVGKIMLPFAALGFAATPDAPSVLFWTAAVWALAEVQTTRRANWFLAIGLFAGLGVLSKFTNLFFGLALVIWLVATKGGRDWLRHWQVWAGAVLGCVVLVPFALWNAQHDWIGLERQFGRLAEAQGFSAVDYGLFWVSVIVLVTPVLFWLVLTGLRSKQVPPVLLWLIAPIVLYLTYHATQAVAGGQWLLPIFPSLAVIAALATRQGRLMRWAAPTGLTLAALVLVLGFWPGRVVISGQNPFTQGRGWDQAIAEIRQLAVDNDAVWIATDAYGLTGQLTWYLGHEIPVWSVTEPKRYLFRGALPPSLCGEKAMFVSRTEFPGGVSYFQSSTAGQTIIRHQGDRVIMSYYTAIVSGLKTCAR